MERVLGRDGAAWSLVRLLTQDSATGSYFEGDESRIHPLRFLIDTLNHLIILEIQAGLFASDFSTNVFVHIFSLSHMLCFAHLILPYFITLCVFDELVMQSDWAVPAYRSTGRKIPWKKTCGKTTIEI